MSTVAEIEAAIQALPPAERQRLADDLPAILPELNGAAAWQRLIADERLRPALTALGDEIAAQLKANPTAFRELRSSRWRGARPATARSSTRPGPRIRG